MLVTYYDMEKWLRRFKIPKQSYYWFSFEGFLS